MNYIPKVGDLVVLNKEALLVKTGKPTCVDKFEKGPQEISKIVSHNNGSITVYFKGWGRYSIGIVEPSGRFWSAPKDAPSLFLPANDSQEVVNYKDYVDYLKHMNSRPDVIMCAKCGGQLKEPWPGLKHCPKCEP